MTILQRLLVFTSMLSTVLVLTSCSQDKPMADSAAAEATEEVTFASLKTSADHYPGLLDFYRLEETGELYMRITTDDLQREFLHLATFQDGIAANGSMRGIHASKRIIRLQKDYDKLQFLQVNTQHYFDPANAISRAAKANLAPAVLAIAEIIDENEQGDLLIKAGPIFLSEALHQIKFPGNPDAEPNTEFHLGELSTDKTRLQELRSYPENVDLIVNYVYEDPAPKVSGGPSLSDNRYVTMVLQHSLLALPDNDFSPRFEDPRLGYFTDRITDQTSYSATPWRDPIHRWNLVKKNPEAELSDPVEPIVFWLENTTPHEFRDVIRTALLTWNQAFESAGFSNAIVAKVQPDDAQWDAADIRYNVLRWTSSDESTWGGYGPSWSHPRTGQILGADIMLEFGWLTAHLSRDRIFSQTMLPGSSLSSHDKYCALGAYKQSQLMLARAITSAMPGSATDSELVKQSLYDLVIHEVGHTLGLNHNFKGSHMLSPAELANAEVTAKRGVSASVMDYLSINFAGLGETQTHYYPISPGPYDHWAIEYGYSQAEADPILEQQRLDAILNRSTRPDLKFGLDADDMRRSESGIDPRAMIFDQSSKPIIYARNRIELVESVMAALLQKMAQPGQSWQEVYNAYLSLTLEWSRQLIVTSRWIGGLYVDRSFQQQVGAGDPLTPIPLKRQRAAMDLLNDRLFAPDAMQFNEKLYRHLQQQRRGQNLWEKPQDPKLHSRFLTVQKGALDHLLHPVVLARINDSALYGNNYTLSAVLTDLTEAIFAADMNANVNTVRQQLQREYVEQLLAIVDIDKGAAFDHVSRGAAFYQLQHLQQQLKARPNSDVATLAHTAALLHRIETDLYQMR